MNDLCSIIVVDVGSRMARRRGKYKPVMIEVESEDHIGPLRNRKNS